MSEHPGFFFRNLIFSSEDEVSELQSSFSRHIARIRQLLGELELGGSLIISGSLARGEPSLSVTKGNVVGLRSDIDWVLLDNNIESGTDRGLESVFSQHSPGFLDTVYRLPAERLPILRSASARDLHLGMQRPIIDGGNLREISRFDLTPIHALEVIVYYSVSVLAHPSADGSNGKVDGMWARGGRDAESKLAVEAMRMASIHSASDFTPCTYAAAYANLKDGFLSDTISFSLGRDLLRSRENLSTVVSPDSLDVGSLVFKCLSLAFEAHDAEPIELLRHIRENYLPSRHILHFFPILVVGTIFLASRLINQNVFQSLFPSDQDLANSSRESISKLRWEYIASLLEAKDKGIQLDGIS